MIVKLMAIIAIIRAMPVAKIVLNAVAFPNERLYGGTGSFTVTL